MTPACESCGSTADVREHGHWCGVCGGPTRLLCKACRPQLIVGFQASFEPPRVKRVPPVKVKKSVPLPADPALLAAVDVLLARPVGRVADRMILDRPEQGMPRLRTNGLARFQTAADYDCVPKGDVPA